jgi:hypothetical protein
MPSLDRRPFAAPCDCRSTRCHRRRGRMRTGICCRGSQATQGPPSCT